MRPPCCRTGAMPEYGGVNLLPQAPRCYIPDSSAHLNAEEGIGHFSFGVLLSPCCRLAESEAVPDGSEEILAQKEGAKSSFCAR